MDAIRVHYAGRVSDFLEGGLLCKPDQKYRQVLKQSQDHNDMCERTFGITDARIERSRTSTSTTISGHTMMAVNDTAGWLHDLQATDSARHAEMFGRAMRAGRTLEANAKARAAHVKVCI